MVKYGDIEDAVPALQSWLQLQPHLPKIELIPQKHFIRGSDGDLERAKHIVEHQYRIRNSYPEIFLHRDPLDVASQSILETLDIISLPGLSSDGYVINFGRLADVDPEKLVVLEAIKLFFMMHDTRLCILDPLKENSKGEKIFLDLEGLTMHHLAKYHFTSFSAFAKFFQEALTVKIEEIHFFNCPTFLKNIMILVTPVLKSDFLSKMQFHHTDSAFLSDLLTKDMIPTEYGGTAGSFNNIKQNFFELVKQKRDYLMDPKYWATDESKRPKHNKYQPDPMEGNFKTLEVD